jgi:ATP-dependent DNA helicase RecG
VTISEERLREIIAQEEGQYHDRKSLLEGPREQRRPRNRREVRDQIAAYVAGFANAEGGVLVCGVENNGAISGHVYPPDVIEEMLAVPEVRLVPPQARGYTCALDGHDVLVFEVDSAPRAVMVDGDGFPYRIGDSTGQFSEEKINSIKEQGLVESAEARPSRCPLEELDRGLIDAAARAGGLDALCRSWSLPRSSFRTARGGRLATCLDRAGRGGIEPQRRP